MRRLEDQFVECSFLILPVTGNDYNIKSSSQAEKLVGASLACLTESSSHSRCYKTATKFEQVKSELIITIVTCLFSYSSAPSAHKCLM